jgi:hypothetical protein
VGGLLYVDDLALISTDPAELQAMLDYCQHWSEHARMQMNADKSKIMVFHENPDDRKTQLKGRPIFQVSPRFLATPAPGGHLTARAPHPRQ